MSDTDASSIDPERYDAAEELDQLEAQDSQVGGSDPLETGYSPPERPLGMREELTLDERLAEEVPDQGADAADPADLADPDYRAPDDVGDLPAGTGEPWDDEVGAARSGRLVAPDEGAHPDRETDLVAEDVGIDGGAASAEEAAVHVVDDGSEVGDESQAT